MSIQKAEMTVELKENGQYVEQVAYPFVEYDHVAMENGMDIMSMIRDDVSTPMVTHNTTSWKVGQGDSDVSETIVGSSIATMTIKGQTYQNILPSPSLRNSMTNGKTMQKLNEGYDSVNTVDGVCKSAILKGQTLVNLAGKPVSVYKANAVDMVFIYENSPYPHRSLSIKPNTTYTIINFNEKKLSSVGLYMKDGSYVGALTVNGKSVVKHTTSVTTEIISFMCRTSEGWTEEEILNENNIMIIEGDYTNVDIPYFEGIQSVKMPVLTTTGKNLLNLSSFETGVEDGFEVAYLNNYTPSINYKENTQYIVRFNSKYRNGYATKVIITHTDGSTVESMFSTTSFTTTVLKSTIGKSVKSITFKQNINDNTNCYGVYVIQGTWIEESPTPTTYEPYKSNILSCNEDVELGSVGEVKDELNLLTGQLMQRTFEITLTGEENGYGYNSYPSDPNDYHGTFNLASAGLPLNMKNVAPLSNVFTGALYGGNKTWQCCIGGSYAFHFFIPKSELETADLTGFKNWVKKQYETGKPVVVRYVVESEQIKTVDLSILDQDNQPVTQLSSFANGCIQVSSQEGTLIPTTEYEVPTSNSYYVDLMKPNTQYTMKNMQGTFTIDGIQYNASANGTFTSPSTLTNKFMITNVVQTQPMLLEGDMTNKEVPYVEGIKSTFEGVDKVEIVSQNANNSLSNTTSFQLAHPLRSLPNGVRDEIVLDRQNHKVRIIQRVGEGLTQLDTPIVTEVNLEGYPYVYKEGYVFLNTEIAPITEVTYSINQAHQIESSNEDILRHQNEINHLYQLIAQYVQVQYEAELIDIALQG